MGADVVIMNVRTIKSKGFLGLFKQTTYEVTAAKEDTEQGTPMAAFHSPFKMHGVVQGIPICFDAKECAKDIFPLQNIHEHQVEFMRQYEEQGGISFLLIYFTSRHVCYYMSFQEMMKYWNRAKEGGVKHFKYEELDIGFFVPLKQGMILHYLECLQKVLEQKDQ